MILLSIFPGILFTSGPQTWILLTFICMIGSTFKQKFYQYKLYHIPFWLTYHILWWTVALGSVTAVFQNLFFSAYAIKFLFYVILEAAGVYFNLYYLMPRFLARGKYVAYVLLVLLTILSMAVLIVFGYDVSAWLSGQSFDVLYGHADNRFWYFFQVNTLPSAAAAMTLGMSVKLAKEWIQTKKRQQVLEKEKLETELRFLKSQFNPHFLFNSINSIFVLIHKNPDMASESLAKFSDLLRYQLYECNEAEINLTQEIFYIENFIELEKLRQDHNINLEIDIEKNNTTELLIAPFILMPFIENAFKHVSKRKEGGNWIEIKMETENEVLQFCVRNSVSSAYNSSREMVRYNGLGLKNVQRRLDLLYPGQHKLEIRSEEQLFEISLQLKLKHNPVAEGQYLVNPVMA